MSYFVLDSSKYLEGLKWYFNRSNIIDTFKFKVYDGTLSKNTVGSATLTQAVLDSDGTAVTLPLTDNTHKSKNTIYSWGKGRTSAWSSGPYAFSKGFVSVYMATISTDITISTPASSISAELSLSGSTKQIGHSSKGYNFYPNVDGEDNYSTNKTIDIVTLIENNYTSSSVWFNSLSPQVDYTAGSVPFTPWVKQVIKANGDDSSKANMTATATILTRWTGGYGSGHDPYTWSAASLSIGWLFEKYDETNANHWSDISDTRMWPDAFYTNDRPLVSEKDQRAMFSSTRLKLSTTITKTDDYHYNVKVQLPVKYVYMAASCYNNNILLVESYHDTDSLAFVDYISEVVVSLVSVSYLGSAIDYAYSLKDDGTLTTDVKNGSIFSLSENELIKSDTIWSGWQWRDWACDVVLDTYKTGSYVAECSVSVDVALNNNLSIGQHVYVKDLNGNYISKSVGDTLHSYSVVPQSFSRVPTDDIAVCKIDQMSSVALSALLTSSVSASFGTISIYQISKTTFEPARLTNILFAKIELIIVLDSSSVIDMNNSFINLYEAGVTSPTISNSFYNYCRLGYRYGIKSATKILTYVERTSFLSAFAVRLFDTASEQDSYPCAFSIMNIQKVYKDAQFIYKLKMVEDLYIKPTSYRNAKAYTSIITGKECWFRFNLAAIDTHQTIGRADCYSSSSGYSYILFRVRNKSGNAVVEKFTVGRVVINYVQEILRVYTYNKSSGSFVTIRSITFDDYLNGSVYWSVYFITAPNDTFNPEEIYGNLGGNVVSTH